MAIGDTIGNFFAASEDFQPAVGVEDVITYAAGGNANLLTVKNGSAFGVESWAPAVTDKNVKIFISNAIFLGTPASSTGVVTGVQTNA